MQEYVAVSKLGKKLYKEKRTHYKRYKIGMFLTVILLLGMLLVNVGMIQHAENRYQIVENLIIGIGFDMVFIVGAFLTRAVAISGGREVLKSRLAERCMLTDSHFILEYVPHVHETLVYERIQFQIAYIDIKDIVEEDTVGRIAIYGKHTVSKYRPADVEIESVTVSDMPIYVYGYYAEYEQLKKELKCKRSD